MGSVDLKHEPAMREAPALRTGVCWRLLEDTRNILITPANVGMKKNYRNQLATVLDQTAFEAAMMPTCAVPVCIHLANNGHEPV